MTRTIRKFVIEVTPWPSEAAVDEDPAYFEAHPSYQWDIYIDGENWGGGTGPGDAFTVAGRAWDAYNERDNDF